MQAQLLESDRIYVITKTIKSKKVTVNAKSSSNMDVDADIPMIQGVVGGAVKVYGKDETTSSVTYEGNSQLVFGFQAIQLFYENGRYQRLKPLQPGVGMRDLRRCRSTTECRVFDGGRSVHINQRYRSNWIAFVIGIDRYDWNPNAHLNGAVQDALGMTKWLFDPQGGNVPPNNLFLLLSPTEHDVLPKNF